MFEACGVGDATEVARQLAADPKRATSWNDVGWSALHLAAFSGSPEVVKLVLDRGGDGPQEARRLPRLEGRGRRRDHRGPDGTAARVSHASSITSCVSAAQIGVEGKVSLDDAF